MKKRQFQSGLVLYGILMLIIAGFMVSCNGGGSGSDDPGIPAVVGAQKDGSDLPDEDLGTEGIQTTFWSHGSSSFTIQLQLDGTVTPSETIIFRTSTTTLPTYLVLDSNTGIITVTPDNSEHSDTVEFWSEGATSGDNTSAISLRIDFTANEFPPIIGAQKDGSDLADDDPGTEGIQTSFWYGDSSFEIQLQIDDTVTPSETVLYRSSTLPSDYLVLDENTGIVTVTPDWSEHSDTVYFWSEGASSGNDTEYAPLRIDFIAESG